MKSLMQPLGVFCFIGCLLSTSAVLAGAPPKIRADYRAIIRANVMDRVQMSCPVHQQSGDSAGLFFSWLKDNESLPVMMIRLETKGAHLIIEDVEPEDAGVYVCIATNGFGSQRAGIQLIVTDPRTESTTVADIENSPNDLLIEGLSFTEETLRQPRQVRITAGSSLDIHCSVSGYPYPDLIWLKDGVVYKRSQQNQADETSWRTASRLTLAIRRAGPATSANYTCLALGLKGQMQTTFVVSVLDSAVDDMSEVHPANVTEFRGGRAKFHCWVRSSSLPEVEWLKRLPARSLRTDLSLQPDTSLVVGEDHYHKLEGDELMRKEDGSYLKTLQLDPLSENDAGLYLCLGKNRYGYSIERTYLNVKPNYETSKESKSVPISIMVALPSILLLSIACAFVCWMRRREKRRRLAELAALATGWSHGFISPEQQQEHQQQQQAMQTTTETTFGGRGGSGHGSCHSRQALTSGAGCHHLNEEADTGLVVGSPPATKRTGVEMDCRGLKADDLQPNYYFQTHRHHQLEQQRNTSSSLII
ncbi:fibroblast growth factor receptor-like 1 isoform X2 [Daphnia carinata]|uniref:fibroblast growth factor receptor-like 1 isoform X2 n=1 Tax=Daphnia carinata TaxID=120202 RepID=UPI00257948AD|nr:fibroblast growth factor receptor-like 1 isoform X2 [Daphnia carinata]